MSSLNFTENVKCLACFKDNCVNYNYTIDDVYFGKIDILTANCKSCGFRDSSFNFRDKRPPSKYCLKIEDHKDLNIRVIKCGNCDVEIPELDLTISSSDFSVGFISNVEGLLLKCKELVKLLKSCEDESKSLSVQKVLDRIDNAILGREKLTIILIDNDGNSRILSPKVEISAL